MAITLDKFEKQFGDRHTSLSVLRVAGKPWFPGTETAAALGYANPGNAIRMHVGSDEKKKLRELRSGDDVHYSRNEAATVYVNESGLYSLVMRSRIPQAKAFRRWVTHDVLPTIRRTGRYVLGTPRPAELDDRSEECEPEEAAEEPRRKRARPEELWLFVLTRDSDPHGREWGHMIGTAADVDARIRTLFEEAPFGFTEHMRLRCSGHFVKALHARFAEYRNDDGPGREWFFVELPDIEAAISELMGE